jgi:hypothetical protein
MPTKQVTVSADALLAPSGQDAGSGQGIIGALLQMFNALLRLAENCAFTAAGVAVATTTTQVKTVNALTFLINGVFKSKAGTDNFWTVAMFQAAAGFKVIPDGSRAIFLLLIDASGVGSVIQGPVGTTDALATVPADTIPADKCIVGTVKAVCAGTTFTPGTDAWNKASVTFTFSDGYDATMVGAAGIGTRV